MARNSEAQAQDPPKRLRVLSIAWNAKAATWERFKPQFEAIGQFHDLLMACPWEIGGLWPDVTKIPTPPDGYYNSLRGMMDYCIKVVKKLPDFDVIYNRTGGPRRQLTDVFIAQFSKKPIVCKVAGDGHRVRFHYVGGGYQLNRIMQDTLDRVSLNSMDRLVPLSSRLAEKLRQYVQDPGKIAEPVMLGCDLSKFVPRNHQLEKTMGYAGRISPEKGAELLQRLVDTSPVSFRIAGAMERVKFKFPDNVHYDGILPYGQMPDWYQKVSAVLLPSYPECEGLPNAVIEAYASAKPVIVTDGLLPPELPLFGFELPHNPMLWADFVKNVDPLILRNLGLYARQWMTKNWPSWMKFGENMGLNFIHACNKLRTQ